MTYVELHKIVKRFGDTVAVASLDLSIEKGELVTLLGPSGCGKSTTLRIVAGFEHADEGSVTVDGRTLTNVPPSRRDMGMVFQAYSLFPNMTAEENVAFGLRVRRWKRAQRTLRAVELLDLVGLTDARTRYPHQLSGGMQQRVALARALAIEPRILLLDEPLSALDAKVRAQLREEISRIQSELGTTTLYVTHDQEEALSMSNRVAVLCGGRIEQIGTPAEIYGDPSTAFVADFIGTTSRLEVTVSDPSRGEVELAGVRLQVCPLNGRRRGEDAIVLLRPEAIHVEVDVPDRTPPGNGLAGQVLSHTFLGANTRMKIRIADGEIAADVPSAVADALPIGSPVRVSFRPDSARVLAHHPYQRGRSSASSAVVEAPGGANGR